MFLTAVNLIRLGFKDPGKRNKSFVTRFLRQRRIFQLSANYFGRKRNCYSIAIRYVQRAMVYATKGRKLNRENQRAMWTDRLRAATDELGIPYSTLTFGLKKSNVLLNHRILSDLAIWEPRTFECLTKIAAMKEHLDPPTESVVRPDKPDGVITRGML